MLITTIKTDPITYPAPELTEILDRYLPPLPDYSIVAVTSKLVSICQGRLQRLKNKSFKKSLIHKEADWYLDSEPYPGIILTIKDGILIPSAGIDESNGDKHLILWPEHVNEVANELRNYLEEEHASRVGIIITDSHTAPLRWGTTGIGLAYSGFKPLKNYIGMPDIFGKKMEVTQANILDGLAAAAVVAMGEGNEQTPLAIITDIPFVTFEKTNPTVHDLDQLKIPTDEDIFAPLLTSIIWKKGGVH